MFPPNPRDDIQSSSRGSWKISASLMSKNTFNPIRSILETMNLEPNPEKPMISLSIGDPTVFGNLNPPPNVLDAISKSLMSGQNNGYAPSTGYPEAKKTVATHISKNPNVSISGDDVILCSGCSSSIDLCISVIANAGDNILVPRPGFPLYATLANGLGIETKEYNLLPEQNWEVDLAHLESMIDENTCAIVVNNPSNPCGSVFEESHLEEILAIADKHFLPIIADEIYEHFVFEGSKKKYLPLASLTSTVPILSCGGLTKRYLIPGWRLGWITIHDAGDVFRSGGIRQGLNSLSQRIIGSNTIVQGALKSILEDTPESFYKETLSVIEINARLAFEKLNSIPGLKPVMPDGAMYMMVAIDLSAFPGFETDLQVVEALVAEQSVFCLPGKCFNIPDFFRIVLTVPKDMLVEACNRIQEFCADHQKVVKLKNRFLLIDKNETEPMSEGESSGSGSPSSSNSPVVSHPNSCDEHDE